MTLVQKIDEFAALVEDSENDQVRRRMKAALRIGARVAIEHLLFESPYSADLKKGLAELAESDKPVISGRVTISMPEREEPPVPEAAPRVELTPPPFPAGGVSDFKSESSL